MTSFIEGLKPDGQVDAGEQQDDERVERDLAQHDDQWSGKILRRLAFASDEIGARSSALLMALPASLTMTLTSAPRSSVRRVAGSRSARRGSRRSRP